MSTRPAPRERMPRPRLNVRRVQVFLFVAILAGLPFAAYRLPHGETIILEGEIHDIAVEPSPSVLNMFRQQFEGFFGNEGLSLVDGPRVYVSREDYLRCWPDELDDLHDPEGYSVRIAVEARPLLFGGYDIGTVTSVERVDNEIGELPAAAVMRSDAPWRRRTDDRPLPPKGFYR